MASVRPFIEVVDQDHAPFLAEDDMIGHIAAFITFCDVTALSF